MLKRRSVMIGAAAMGVTAWSSMAAAQPADPAALLATLMELEKGSWQFVKSKDLAGMRNYLADEAVLIFGDGSRYTKAEFLKAIPDFRLDSFTIAPNAEVKVWSPDVATLLYRITYASAMKDAKAVTLKVTSASTYVRRNGKWWSVLYQETLTP
jgi:Domain of unknown function (DUF4440)